MKRILMAGAFLALAAGTQAMAADLPPPSAPPPRAPAMYVPTTAPVYNWGGLYVGINGGYGFGNSTWSTTGLTTGNFSTDGFLVGGTIGANYQVSEFVFGVEADLDWTNITGSTSSTVCTSCQTSNDWLGTARGRLGFAADRVLFYGTGGAAFGNVQATVPPPGGGTDTSTEIGWTAGGGVEVAFAQNWTAKVEYL